MEHPTGTLIQWLFEKTPQNDEDPENGPLDAALLEGHAHPPSGGVAFGQNFTKGLFPMLLDDTIRAVLSITPSADLNMDGLFVHALAVQYADPKDKAFPIDQEHIHAAIAYFGKYAHRYPEALQKQMARRILRAALRLHVEVAPDSRVREIAEGRGGEPHGTHHPGTSKVADEHHRESGVESGNGPSGPHPFPQETSAEHHADQHDVGNLDLFHMIRELEERQIQKPDMKESAELLSLVDELSTVLQGSSPRAK